MYQEGLYLKEIFQSAHSKFLGALDYLWNHTAAVEDSEITTQPDPNQSGPFKMKCSFWNR